MGGKKDEFSVDNILSEVQLNSKPSKTSEPKKEVDIDSLLNEIMLKKEPSRGNQKKSELKKENEAEFASLNYPLTDKKRFVLDKDFLAKHEDQAIKTNKENEKTILFDKAPQKKEFVMEGSRQQKENEKKPSVQAPPKKEETDDLHSPEDIPAILLDIKELKTSLLLRMGVLLLVGIVALGIVVLNVFRFVNISDMIDQSADPMLYSLIQFALLLIASAFSYTTLTGGLFSIIKLKLERDAIPALTTLICLIQNIMIAINPYKLLDENVHLYSVIAIFVLLFNTIGKLLIVSRAQLNFKLVSSEYKKYGVLVMEDDTEASGYTRGLINDMPCLAYNKRTDFLTDFMYYSYGEDASDKISKFLVPISLGAALILFIAMQFVMRDIYVAATAFTATICICSPLSHLFVVNAPLKRAAKKLYKYGCAILGYKSAEDFSETNATIIHAKDLFPHGAVTLFGIKTFSGMRIDEAILDAASVACSARSILSDIFMQVIAHKTELLKKVDNILYEDTMGLSAWVENKRVLIGTRELMLNHGVDVPSKDYEERYISEGNELIYLSTAGELTAVFVIGFKAMPEVKDALKKLEQNDVFLVVNSVDAVLTRDKLAIVFDVPKEMFKIMPARLHSHYSEITQKTPQLSSSVVNNGAFFSYITGLVVAKRMKSMMMIGNVVQAASMVVGYGLLAVFSFLRDFSQLTTLLLFVFQLSWFVVTMITMKIKQL